MKSHLPISKIHHVSIICSDFERSRTFYTEILGFTILQEIYRSEKDSYKLDLALNGHYMLELFSFASPPERPSYPEACGLRHIAFETDDIEAVAAYFKSQGIDVEPIRIDEHTHKRFTFIQDPDKLPIEFYEH